MIRSHQNININQRTSRHLNQMITQSQGLNKDQSESEKLLLEHNRIRLRVSKAEILVWAEDHYHPQKQSLRRNHLEWNQPKNQKLMSA